LSRREPFVLRQRTDAWSGPGSDTAPTDLPSRFTRLPAL
jgi:hypothetical protein